MPTPPPPSTPPTPPTPAPQGQPDFAQRAQRLKADLIEQARRVQALSEAAFEAVFTRNKPLADRVPQLDDVIDRADVAIEKASVALLLDATAAHATITEANLRLILTIVKINNELERIADVGVDLAALTRPNLPNAAPHPAFPDTFRVMANSVIGILRDVSQALLHDDPVLAKVVLQSQHTVTAFKDALLRDAEEKISKSAMPLEFAFQLHEIAGLCEIVADHSTNIAEQIIYLTTGAIVRHEATSWVEVPSAPNAGGTSPAANKP
ncbi:MAG: phosphate uptake regulator PhoU [Phycisphaerales bacterium]